jgi:pilus assembly protein Flp/PilA
MAPAEGAGGLSHAAGGQAAGAGAARSLLNFLHDTDGATAIEYALVASLIAVAIVAVLGQLGLHILAMFQTVKF